MTYINAPIEKLLVIRLIKSFPSGCRKAVPEAVPKATRQNRSSTRTLERWGYPIVTNELVATVIGTPAISLHPQSQHLPFKLALLNAPRDARLKSWLHVCTWWRMRLDVFGIHSLFPAVVSEMTISTQP